MTNPQKNLLTMFVAALLAMAIFFFFPGVSFPQESTCPAAPEGALSPKDTLQPDWEMGAVPVGDEYILVVMRNKKADAQISHAMGVFLIGSDWPVLFNYIENGVLRFLRFDIKSQQYVWDETVDDSSYDLVVKMYRVFLKVDVSPRKGV